MMSRTRSKTVTEKHGGSCLGEAKEVKTCFMRQCGAVSGSVSGTVSGTVSQLPNTGCQRIRIRKEVRSLTPSETQKIRNALEQVMTNPTNGQLFKDIGHYHGAPFTICSAPAGCCPHENAEQRFLTWHRLYTGTPKNNLILT